MNNAIQFLNKSVLLSICLHLIGVGIASLSVVGTSDKYGDAIVAEFVSVQTPKARKKIARTPRRIELPEPTQPEKLRLQSSRVQTPTEVTDVRQNELHFAVDTLPVSATHQPVLAGTGITDKQALQSDLPLRLRNGTSQPVRFTPSRMPRPEWTSTPPVIASAQAAELPPIPALFNEPTENARFSRRIDPIYPESARLAHKQGIVVLEATIGVDGIARNIEIVKVVEVSGLGCEEAAIAALKASQFVPAKQGKVVVSQRLRIPYRFQFKSE